MNEKILILAAIAFIGWIAYTHTTSDAQAGVVPTPSESGDSVPWELTYNYPVGFTGSSTSAGVALPQQSAGQANAQGCTLCSIMGGNQF